MIVERIFLSVQVGSVQTKVGAVAAIEVPYYALEAGVEPHGTCRETHFQPQPATSSHAHSPPLPPVLTGHASSLLPY